MSAAVLLRPDFNADELRQLARASRDAGQSRRLLALAVIHDGGRRSEAARVGAVGLQTVRDWVLAFNAEGPAGLVDGKAPGQRPKLDAAQRRALAEAVEQGPDPERDGVVRWRRKDLAAQGPGGVAPHPFPRQPGRDHGRARAAEARLCQDVGATPTLRAGSGGAAGVQKRSCPPRWTRSEPR